MVAQGFAEGQSVIRPPLFNGENYQYWKMRMEWFIRGTDFDLWQVIEVGDFVVVPAEAKISTAMDLAIKFKSVQNTDPSSKHKENGGIQDARKNPEKCRDLGHMYRIEICRLLAFLKTSKGIYIAVEALLGQSQEASKTPLLLVLGRSPQQVGVGKAFLYASASSWLL
ncbi:hypothetical protein Taro_003725 [Colocasia esculenta]|uniref:DUF4219 domain-containing protein n=1 Tax=Colocasia esculenta TaxID=4460 RepID=A0A843TMZ7_COLES|nr:hypothetical protein [Colocasia esculenta]